MRATGIVKRVDQLGRVVLPVELRRTFGIKEYDGLEIYTYKDQIILQKHELTCVFCGSRDEVTKFKEKNVCKECLSAMRQKAADNSSIFLRIT
ncbi:Transition state regulatory protein AbrB [Sporomusa ovata DSM 2662]|uniref:Transition state regulatory protein AbrB n=1 Tax=Sporomusa ovata TaxID=2378 RepID=A0A0U1KVY9_9FIRM|nr:AbrB/MazE/SpoVT family DNA-binding domain-containing protein [Sporomusa ovata]EQB28065.1 transcriptional regulator, AbrB family [Sporomusa ovata DSM 2662]CQR71602.1 Transition state regulatory protein AbrB [Sporomusa ovata]